MIWTWMFLCFSCLLHETFLNRYHTLLDLLDPIWLHRWKRGHLRTCRAEPTRFSLWSLSTACHVEDCAHLIIRFSDWWPIGIPPRRLVLFHARLSVMSYTPLQCLKVISLIIVHLLQMSLASSCIFSLLWLSLLALFNIQGRSSCTQFSNHHLMLRWGLHELRLDSRAFLCPCHHSLGFKPIIFVLYDQTCRVI